MKLSRFSPIILAFIGVFATLTVTARWTWAAPNSGVVGNGTPGSCTDAALTTALSGGGLVTFNCGGPATLTATLKTIAAHTTIDGTNNGQALTLTASGMQLFTINSGIGLTLTNVTVANLSGASYAFPIVNNGRLLLTNTSVISNYYFINSTANSAVNIAYSTFMSNTGVTLNASGPFTLNNSHLQQNTPGGSGMFIVFNGVTGTVDNSDFISNSTSTSALLYSNGGAFAITNSRFQQNAGAAALIGAYGVVTIDHSDFISNTTTAVYSTRPLVISNSRFYWNRSAGYASVVHMYGYGWTPALTLTNSSLMSNTAAGGAIYDNGGPAYISNTQFVSNTSTNNWGALYLDYPGVVQVLSSTFQLNTGGCIFANGQSNPLSIADSQFISNTATGTAAGISVGPVTVTHSSFINNIANTTGNPHAGALEASRQAYIADSVFVNNVGTNGGALLLSSGGFGPFYDVVANTLIKGNTSTLYGGGGIRATQYLTLIDSEVSDNTALGNAYGGGLYFANGYVLTVTNVLFHNNIVTGASSLGGGVYFHGASGVISNSTILSNSAGSGGGVYQNSGPLQIANTTIQTNTARTFFGGGLEAHDALTLRDVNVSGNRNTGSGGQGYGGGLYVASFANPLQVNRSLFYNNVASHANSQGGGIYLTSPALITNTTLYSNSAGNGGTGLNYNTTYPITLTNLTIVSNTNASGVITSQLNNTGTAYRVRLVNTLIGGSNSGNCAGNKVLSLGHNLSSDGSCAITTTGDLSNTNPLLGAFQNNGGFTDSFMPTASSPAVNAGDNSLCPDDDQRGIGRPIGAACDIGSIESAHLTPQTITFDPLPDHIVTNPPFPITATASSGLSVAFTASGVCSINSSTVTLSGVVGSCTITATQFGNVTYAPATPVARSFNVTAQLTQTITFNAIPDHFINDAPFSVAPTASSGLSVSVTSLTTSVCSVSNNLITLLTTGTCTLRASQPGDATYAAAPNVDRTFYVTLVPQSITFDALPDRLVGEPPFAITATTSSGLVVSFNAGGVCGVNGSLVTLGGVAGSCTITATQSGNATYAAAAPVARSFNVTALLTQTITFDTIPDHFVNDTPFVIAPTASSGLSVSVTSLTTSVCTVSSNLVTLLSAGTCTLRAAQAGNATYAAAPNVERSFTVKLHTLYLPLVLR